eukprot:4318053-Ditylum_brightwellii.AAC.1
MMIPSFSLPICSTSYLLPRQPKQAETPPLYTPGGIFTQHYQLADKQIDWHPPRAFHSHSW